MQNNMIDQMEAHSIFRESMQLQLGYTVGIWQVSKCQTCDIYFNGWHDAYLPFADDTCQDSALVDLVEGIFGVFDGVGSDASGREAAISTASQMHSLLKESTCESGKDLARLVDQTNRLLVSSSDYDGSSTTASVVKILGEEHNCFKLAYAQVGDSRIYLVTSSGVRRVTQDEVDDERNLTHVVGDRLTDHVCVQFGEFFAKSGDCVVIVSDGVTGSNKEAAMTDDEVGQHVRSAGDAFSVARTLITNACELDDLTVVAIKFT